jgi:hypothetical protein
MASRDVAETASRGPGDRGLRAATILACPSCDKMKELTIVVLLALMPAVVLADAMATCIAVFDAGTYRAITATNSAGKVAEGDLYTKSVFHGYFGSRGQGKDDVSADFTWDKRQYRLLIGRRETKTIYSVTLTMTNQAPKLVAVGEITNGAEARGDAKGDPFVVVIRDGNYLSH